ncbi:hypothetical protein J6590_081836 [Homalodisca vitripennis]|nr:hypothetical protein J6590_081836 [Homalodisca vitripennis]
MLKIGPLVVALWPKILTLLSKREGCHAWPSRGGCGGGLAVDVRDRHKSFCESHQHPHKWLGHSLPGKRLTAHRLRNLLDLPEPTGIDPSSKNARRLYKAVYWGAGGCRECRDTDPVIVSACGDTAVGIVASWDRPEDSAQYWTTPVEGYDTGETVSKLDLSRRDSKATC